MRDLKVYFQLFLLELLSNIKNNFTAFNFVLIGTTVWWNQIVADQFCLRGLKPSGGRFLSASELSPPKRAVMTIIMSQTFICGKTRIFPSLPTNSKLHTHTHTLVYINRTDWPVQLVLVEVLMASSGSPKLEKSCWKRGQRSGSWTSQEKNKFVCVCAYLCHFVRPIFFKTHLQCEDKMRFVGTVLIRFKCRWWIRGEG